MLESLFIIGLLFEGLLATERFKRLELYIESLGQGFFPGILIGVFLTLCYFIRINGLYAAVKEGQIHYLTLIWLTLTALAIYHRTQKPTLLKRALFTFFLVLFVYVAHDFFWISKSYWRGIQLTTHSDTSYPDINYYLGSYSRIAILSSLSIWHLSKSLRISKPFLFFFALQLAYHASLVIFQVPLTLPGLPNDTLLGLPIDSLPYIFILKQKKKEGELT